MLYYTGIIHIGTVKMSKKPNLLVDATFKNLYNEDIVFGERTEAMKVDGKTAIESQKNGSLRYLHLKEYTYHTHHTNTHDFARLFPNLQEYFIMDEGSDLHYRGKVYNYRLDFKVTPVMQEVIKCVTIPMQNELTRQRRIIAEAQRCTTNIKNELEQQEVMWSQLNNELRGIKSNWFYKLGKRLGLI